MANMIENQLSEAEIDEIVVAQANDDDAWEEAISVEADIPTTVSLPRELARRAAFFAKLHSMPTDSWLTHIIQERVDFEESAFAGVKQVMEKRASYKT